MFGIAVGLGSLATEQSSFRDNIKQCIIDQLPSTKISEDVIDAAEHIVMAFIKTSINGAYQNALDRAEFQLEQKYTFDDIVRTTSHEKQELFAMKVPKGAEESPVAFSGEMTRKQIKAFEQSKKDLLTRKATDALAMAEIAKSYAMRPKFNQMGNSVGTESGVIIDPQSESQSKRISESGDITPIAAPNFQQIHMNAEDLIEFYSFKGRQMSELIDGMAEIIDLFKNRTK